MDAQERHASTAEDADPAGCLANITSRCSWIRVSVHFVHHLPLNFHVHLALETEACWLRVLCRNTLGLIAASVVGERIIRRRAAKSDTRLRN